MLLAWAQLCICSEADLGTAISVAIDNRVSSQVQEIVVSIFLNVVAEKGYGDGRVGIGCSLQSFIPAPLETAIFRIYQ